MDTYGPAEILGNNGYEFSSPGIAPPAAGCALVAGSGSGTQYQLGWTLRPVLMEPAVGPLNSNQYLAADKTWKSIPPIDSGSVVGALGYTPVNRAGDTMTGALNVLLNQNNALGVSLRNTSTQTNSGVGFIVNESGNSSFAAFTYINAVSTNPSFSPNAAYLRTNSPVGLVLASQSAGGHVSVLTGGLGPVGASTERLRITSSGRILAGPVSAMTDDGSSILQVGGAISASGNLRVSTVSGNSIIETQDYGSIKMSYSGQERYRLHGDGFGSLYSGLTFYNEAGIGSPINGSQKIRVAANNGLEVTNYAGTGRSVNIEPNYNGFQARISASTGQIELASVDSNALVSGNNVYLRSASDGFVHLNDTVTVSKTGDVDFQRSNLGQNHWWRQSVDNGMAGTDGLRITSQNTSQNFVFQRNGVFSASGGLKVTASANPWLIGHFITPTNNGSIYVQATSGSALYGVRDSYPFITPGLRVENEATATVFEVHKTTGNVTAIGNINIVPTNNTPGQGFTTRASGSNGGAALLSGDNNSTGYIQWTKPNGTRQGFAGYDGGSDIGFYNEAGGAFSFQANGGLRARNAANNADAPITAGAITASSQIRVNNQAGAMDPSFLNFNDTGDNYIRGNNNYVVGPTSFNGAVAITNGHLTAGAATFGGNVQMGNGILFDTTRRMFGAGQILYQANSQSTQHYFGNAIGTSLSSGAVVEISTGASGVGSGVNLLNLTNQSGVVASISAAGAITASGPVNIATNGASGLEFYNVPGGTKWSVVQGGGPGRVSILNGSGQWGALGAGSITANGDLLVSSSQPWIRARGAYNQTATIMAGPADSFGVGLRYKGDGTFHVLGSQYSPVRFSDHVHDTLRIGIEVSTVMATGNIQQGFNSITPSYRSRMLAAGQRASEVGDGAGAWSTVYREDYNGGTMRFGWGAALTPVQSIAAAATDAASTQTLANSIRTILLNLGLVI